MPTVSPKSSQSTHFCRCCAAHMPPLPTCMVCRELIKFFFFSKGAIFLGAKGKIKQGVQMRFFLSRLGNEFRFERETYYVILGCRCVNIITLLLSVIYVLLCDTGQRLSVTVPDGSLYMSLIRNHAVSCVLFHP